MPQKYFITTFGCQMNVHDSETLAGLLTSLGYSPASLIEEADIILFNTCCVRENAENRTYGNIGALKALKQARPELIIGMCGCMVQQPSEVAKIKQSYPYVDLVFGTHNLHQLPELIHKVQTSGSRVIEVWDTDGAIYEDLPIRRAETFRAWVTIMYGCNNFCAYCIVPYVRGRERSRKPEQILAEIQDLVRDGVKEITLLGQNVNSYGKDLTGGERWNFARLLREIAYQTDIQRIRFQTSHPKDLSDDLIETLATEAKVCRHLHLPLQSGSTRVLQLMNRRYTREQYRQLAAEIKNRNPGIALTTDIIVGFPGELEGDFQDTLALVSEIGYDGAFTFIYSPRLGTPAAKMADPVSEAEKKRHLAELMKIQNQISLVKNQAFIGTVTEVLVEGVSERNPGMWSGRNSQNKLVHFKPVSQLKPGNLIPVSIISATTFTLEGEFLSSV
ncbi:MAG TPA: tRNA (N6-isopentenyl adenosine(37)-C2)-methylthiotransferase MiaB [Firmicutes bacterium]|jgi:tRNA-2-methylthio-N6-dimethylallyladenosine synthase|nr:tRNA (N6-isopentenyl adenosine(37)-C2)-methylthiotransferase MiaB [Bacillota bacterium]